MKMCHALLLMAGLVAMTGSSRASDYIFTTLDFPGTPTAVSGGTVVGYNGSSGFIYNGSTLTTVDYPLFQGQTYVTGISGGTVVGFDVDEENFGSTGGFAYDGSTFTDLPIIPLGISGSTMVGYYDTLTTNFQAQTHGCIYNGSTVTTLDFPGAVFTEVNGISGGTVVGIYNNYNNNNSYLTWHGFIYNGSTFTTLDVPGGTNTQVTGISGGTVVGSYEDSSGLYHGFIYDGSAFTTVDDPGAVSTKTTGICGNTVVGYYWDQLNVLHGFIAQISEPLLRISLTTSNTLALSWPYPSTGLTLQENSDLTTTNWVAPSETIANDSTNNFINIGPPSGNRFFRLKTASITPAP